MAYQQNFPYNGAVFSTGLANYRDTSTAVTRYEGRQALTVTVADAADAAVNAAGKYSVFDVADWFLAKSPMTHKKLQKLCYYAQAWSCALYGRRLVKANFEAWIHGPVSPVLYDRFKRFGYETITLLGTPEASFEAADAALLEDVWAAYGAYTGNALEALSHGELPWQEARKGYGPQERCSVSISPQAMANYYRPAQNRRFHG